ncbi:hypothetical protein PLESTB_001504900 [Pleodorina starrii]|uniref:Uncharacterized protein n=1 Tax=Pleodorina starrii TaxID=330485 RepID=A0A9W6BXE6_9CHLO|nr:hypothetical protein PLESTB_001504900 [Pleodorina starrii]
MPRQRLRWWRRGWLLLLLCFGAGGLVWVSAWVSVWGDGEDVRPLWAVAGGPSATVRQLLPVAVAALAGVSSATTLRRKAWLLQWAPDALQGLRLAAGGYSRVGRSP